MLVYDITNEKSFDNIKNWIRNIEEVGVPGRGRDMGAFAGSHVKKAQEGWGQKRMDCCFSGERRAEDPQRGASASVAQS